MENKKNNLSIGRMILLLILYFGGYMYYFPLLASRITLEYNPFATHIEPSLILINECTVLLLCLWICWPVVKTSWVHFQEHKKKCMKTILFSFIGIMAINFTLSLIVSLITHQTQSANQQEIMEITQVLPVLSVIEACFFAPIIEECVFRAGVYSALRAKTHIIIAVCISSLLFGFIHVFDSLLSGNFVDLAFLIVYAAIGCVLALSYEKEDSLFVSIGLHCVNNLFAIIIMLI